MIAIYFNGPSAKKVLLRLNYVTWKLIDFVLEKKRFFLFYSSVQTFKIINWYMLQYFVKNKESIAKEIFHGLKEFFTYIVTS